MSADSDINQLIANAKKQIEERKKGMTIGQASEDRLAAMAALQARISARMNNLEMNGLISMTQEQLISQQIIKAQTDEEREKSLNIVIDSEGRTIDKRTGEIVQLQSRVPTLKANLRLQKREIKSALAASGLKIQDKEVKSAEKINKYETVANEEKPAVETTSSFFDARLKLKSNIRNKRKLAFHDKGKFEEMAKKLRDKAKLEILKKEISQISKKTGISSESKLALIQPKRYQKESAVPAIEWWDFAVLNEPSYDCLDILNDNELKEKLGLTNLIEHPIQMKPPAQSDKPVIPTVMLTAKERKKLRRQNRAEALKEEQEKIRLGLIPPPEPKVKISNLMRVLGTEAVQDPTKIEEYVRNQMAKRQKMHEEANAARKLTPEQRSEKKKRKIMEDTSTGVRVAVYRVNDLSDPSVKFKIEANCNQLHMTGVVVLCKFINIVVVEGGPKQQRKFRRLMMNRIKWSELNHKKSHQHQNDDENSQARMKNVCKLVWEGMIKQRLFSNIIFKSSPTVTFARDFFKKHNCEHYWDIAQSDVIIESSET